MRPVFSAAEADALFAARWGRMKRRPRPAAKPKPPRPAAGILLRHTDPDGEVWYLLGLRCPRLGGTWSNIGGSLEEGEHPLVGALREFDEELAIRAAEFADSRIAQVIECGTDAVPYTLFVIDCPRFIDGAVLGWENDELYWWHADEVPHLNLHNGFARAWATLTGGAA